MRHPVPIVVVLMLTLSAVPLRAQNPGLPVYNLGVPRGIGVYADVGFPNEAAGKGTAYGATARVGFGDLGATATVSGGRSYPCRSRCRPASATPSLVRASCRTARSRRITIRSA